MAINAGENISIAQQNTINRYPGRNINASIEKILILVRSTYARMIWNSGSTSIIIIATKNVKTSKNTPINRLRQTPLILTWNSFQAMVCKIPNFNNLPVITTKNILNKNQTIVFLILIKTFLKLTSKFFIHI